MNLRESVINSAVIEYAKNEARLRAALRRVAVDSALASEGMPLTSHDEQGEIDAAAQREELPYTDGCGTTCPRCAE